MKKLGRPLTDPSEGRRERFQAVVAPSTIKWLNRYERPGRKLDELVQREIQKEEFNSES